ncbi:Chaperone protein HtpG [Methanosarcinaceae archaeon Ag5]|uniref:Chaperone protein HtpG n=1 Tax=Methanolapillus africanus TaxID=3028297 RepID=A0AAE4SCY4_9EURY|nr:Chaperone protein HtpG [Methanosarcinaceae archaeon Ag5]
MVDFEETDIWKRTLGQQSKEYEKEREILRTEYFRLRDKSSQLAGEISDYFKEYTVHDVTHSDALWTSADMILNKSNIKLNPAEAYVLGSAFLFHDLGMALVAYQGGIKEIKKNPMWKDTVASILKGKLGRHITEKDFENLDPEIEKEATIQTLRSLHASKASKLPETPWKDHENHDVYLIENELLRHSYGYIIGLIASSHGWKVEELEEKLPSIQGAIGGFPKEWTIDPLKLSCILRISDAIQIDDRRAPLFLRTLRKPSKYSDLHWNFQAKLNQPIVENKRLKFTSKSPFKKDENKSWWVCFDTLKMIDQELKEVDSLLSENYDLTFDIIGVESIEDVKRLSRLITVEGWQPIDTKIQVSNVGKLVNMLGGSQLYGNDMQVPLRELLQNAADAIRARRKIDNEDEDFGDIILRIDEDCHGKFIEIEDNGIGMSKDVLTGPFLDFGQSFWGTDLMRREFPGLESKNFLSTGKYGIGFFSVFMWGKKVKVTTNRCDKGRDDSLVLEFEDGSYSRPLLRIAEKDEQIKNGGTRIKVWIDNEIYRGVLDGNNQKFRHRNISDFIKNQCIGFDCNIFVIENEIKTTVVQKDDWMTMSPKDLIIRLIGNELYEKLYSSQHKSKIDMAIENMEFLINEGGEVVGRASLIGRIVDSELEVEHKDFSGAVTVGGFRTSDLYGIIGILKGESQRASRDSVLPTVQRNILHKWIESQVEKLSKFELDEEIQVSIASCARSLKGTTGKLKIAKHNGKYVSSDEIISIVRKNESNEYFIISYEQLYNKGDKLIEFSNIDFLADFSYPIILNNRNIEGTWPEFDFYWGDREGNDIGRFIVNLISEGWGCNLDEIERSGSMHKDPIYRKINKKNRAIYHYIVVKKITHT